MHATDEANRSRAEGALCAAGETSTEREVGRSLRQVFHVCGHADPRMLAPFVDRDGGRGKPRLCKGSDWHSNAVFSVFDLPLNSSPALRAEVKDDSITFVADARILL